MEIWSSNVMKLSLFESKMDSIISKSSRCQVNRSPEGSPDGNRSNYGSPPLDKSWDLSIHKRDDNNSRILVQIQNENQLDDDKSDDSYDLHMVCSNDQEKWRQHSVSSAFVALRRLVPTHPPDKKLSKIEILRVAIRYIGFLTSLLEWQMQEKVSYPSITEKKNTKSRKNSD